MKRKQQWVLLQIHLEVCLDYAINNNGKALLFGVDIYKLTAMHYAEELKNRPYEFWGIEK